jgi:hypothetical protein
VAFQLATLLEHTKDLPKRPEDAGESNESTIAEQLLNLVRHADMEDLATPDALGNTAALEDLLKQLKTGLYDISDGISARYFSHLTPSRLNAF